MHRQSLPGVASWEPQQSTSSVGVWDEYGSRASYAFRSEQQRPP